jgi:hypothetical protein
MNSCERILIYIGEKVIKDKGRVKQSIDNWELLQMNVNPVSQVSQKGGNPAE